MRKRTKNKRELIPGVGYSAVWKLPKKFEPPIGVIVESKAWHKSEKAPRRRDKLIIRGKYLYAYNASERASTYYRFAFHSRAKKIVLCYDCERDISLSQIPSSSELLEAELFADILTRSIRKDSGPRGESNTGFPKIIIINAAGSLAKTDRRFTFPT